MEQFINVYVSGNTTIEALMKKNEDEIKTTVLAKELVIGTLDGITKEWSLNGETVTIGVKKL